MTRLRFFILGAVFAVVGSAFAVAGPPMFLAIPLNSCTAITNVALSASSETVFAAAPGRKKLCLTNRDASIHVFVAYHATATSADVDLGPGQTLCDDILGGYFYEGVVDALAASGTPAVGGWSCN